jgi:hypothetical protein
MFVGPNGSGKSTLVYAWENLYLACVKCQEEKARNFDIRVEPATYQDELLRPDDLDYRFERYFLFNDQNGDIEPNPQASGLDQERARCTIRNLGLNHPGRSRSRKRILGLFAERPTPGERLDDWPYRFLLER